MLKKLFRLSFLPITSFSDRYNSAFKIASILDRLDEESRESVLSWLAVRYSTK